MSDKQPRSEIMATEFEIVKKSGERGIYKEEEFEDFLKLLAKGKVEHWGNVAEVIGVHPNTITTWKRLPEAQQAIVDGITHAVGQMEQSGKNDWRMWREKLKMLGIKEVPQTAVVVQQNVSGFQLTEDQLRRFLGEE